MNPGLVVKLRPAGPWRIGPDSGARNRVDFIYHSDSLYSAVTSAMARLGSLDEWLDATARNGSPAVCFSSCFPFLDEIGFVVPPRTIWPPTSPGSMSARVRWKSARFVPLGIVQSILAGHHLDERQWAVDGASECLVPTGRLGPFRTGVRWNAAVDRLTGAVERHSTACIEFRPGSGLWTVVSFRDDAAHGQWADRVKAAFRLLADTGFGGERSRGWGRAESPEFIDGTLPEMILPAMVAKEPVEPPVQQPPVEEPPVPTPPIEEPPAEPQATEIEENRMVAEGSPQLATPQPTIPDPDVLPHSHETIEENRMTAEGDPQLPPPDPDPLPPLMPEPPEPNPVPDAPPGPPPLEEPMQAESIAPTPNLELSAPGPRPPAPDQAPGFWLLSLFTPAADDSVDWARGNYTVMSRGGRVDSPAGSGELKKQVHMIAEGSVLHAAGVPRGAAADVAPDGFAHPVFRAGFALSIPLPGREGTAS
jgi:CRISPR type III-A-associated RAMP protein Csm4